MKKRANDINVTPLIDVLLVLLVIFMVTAPMLVKEIYVDLPQVVSVLRSKNVIQNDKVTTISFSKDREFFFNGKKVSYEKLFEHLKELPNGTVISLEASKDLSYQLVYSLASKINDCGDFELALSGFY